MKKVAIHGWGRYPVIDADVKIPSSLEMVQGIIQGSSQGSLLARGYGRSYGDSALNNQVVDMCYLDRFLSFDENSGQLFCNAGVSLATILEIFVPRGWFLPVTPGTKFVSVGGAVASDVHGKNHHVHGCFSEFVDTLNIVVASGELITCSRTEYPELFYATCGGMGLTGVIVAARIRLKRIQSSMIEQRTFKAHDFLELFALLDSNRSKTYSVAWVDCLTKKPSLGAALLSVGEHAQTGELSFQTKKMLKIPVDMPSYIFNRTVARIFNAFYYHQGTRAKKKDQQVHYDPYFYPLDKLGNWYKLYGKNGFIQYQCVMPTEAALEGARTLLERISEASYVPMLAVLKAFSKENANFLSFPMEGYTLAVDFKMEQGLLGFLEELDAVVLGHGGRLYLAKDARMSSATFKASYPRWEAFQAVRAQYGAIGKFVSKQSERLGLG